MLPNSYFVYILTNKPNGVLYVGVTNHLIARIGQHREGQSPGFTKKYNLTRLVWYQATDDIEGAILFEKRLKRWRRAWKIELIEKENPHWNDLWEDIRRG